jgi:hypothetical protein
MHLLPPEKKQSKLNRKVQLHHKVTSKQTQNHNHKHKTNKHKQILGARKEKRNTQTEETLTPAPQMKEVDRGAKLSKFFGEVKYQ